MQSEQMKPLSLGAEAYKKMWPKAIFPSDIPGQVPLAMNVKMASVYASSLDENGRSVTKNDFPVSAGSQSLRRRHDGGAHELLR